MFDTRNAFLAYRITVRLFSLSLSILLALVKTCRNFLVHFFSFFRHTAIELTSWTHRTFSSHREVFIHIRKNATCLSFSSQDMKCNKWFTSCIFVFGRRVKARKRNHAVLLMNWSARLGHVVPYNCYGVLRLVNLDPFAFGKGARSVICWDVISAHALVTRGLLTAYPVCAAKPDIAAQVSFLFVTSHALSSAHFFPSWWTSVASVYRFWIKIVWIKSAQHVTRSL